MTLREEFSAADITGLLHELGRRLSKRGIAAQLYIFGGAAVAMAFDARRATADIDATMRPSAEVYAEARAMARELGLNDGWLNSAGAGYLPNLPDDWAEAGQDFSGLRVGVADVRTMIAMKMLATRTRDIKDLVLLFREAGIRRPHEAVTIFRELYPDGVPGRGPTDEDLEIEAAEILALVQKEGQPKEPGRGAQ
jgi:hypothetical protein